MSFRFGVMIAGVAFGVMLYASSSDCRAADAAPAASAQDLAEQELLRLSIEAGERKARAVEQVKKADRMMESKQYAEALELYRSACLLDPENRQAVDGKALAERYLQARPDVAGAAISRQVERAKIFQKHSQMKALNQLNETERLVTQAETVTASTDMQEQAKDLVARLRLLDDADEAWSRASLGLAGVASSANVAEEKRKAQELEGRIKSLRPQLQAQLEKLNQQISVNDTRKQAESVQEVQEQKHEALMTEAKKYITKHEYKKAEDILEQMLKEDRADSRAQALLIDVRQSILDVRDDEITDQVDESRVRLMEQIERDALAEVSPINRIVYPKDWDVLRDARASAQSNQDALDPESQEVLRKLEDLVSIEFEETNIVDALKFLQQRADVTIMPDLSDEGKEQTVSLVLQNTTLENTLHWMLDQLQMRYTVEDGAIRVSDATAQDEETYTEVYDVRDIAFAVKDAKKMYDPDEDEDDDDDDDDDDDEDTITLDEIIKKVLIDDFQRDDANVEFEEGSGMLTVVQTKEAHTRIRKLLQRLRTAQAIQVAISTRFLNIRDDFWEAFETNWYNFTNSNSSSYYDQYSSSGDPESYYTYNSDLYTGDFNTASQTLGSGSEFLDATVNSDYDPGLYNRQIFGNSTNKAVNGISSVYGDNLGTDTSNTSSGLLLQIQQQGWLSEFQTQFYMRLVRETQKTDQMFAPHLVTYNNRYAWIQYVRLRPYIRSWQSAASGDGLEPQREWLRFGSSLEVQPTVSADKKYITIELHPKLTRLWPDEDYITPFTYEAGTDYYLNTVYAQVDTPTILYHELETFATIPDGGSMILTGMGVNVDSKSRNGIPILQDLPVIGNAFCSRGKQKEKRDFMIVLNARMILLDEEEAKIK